VLKLHEFKQWTLRLENGVDIDADTIDEVLEYIARTFKDSDSVLLRKNSHAAWFDHKKATEDFIKTQDENKEDQQEGSHT